MIMKIFSVFLRLGSIMAAHTASPSEPVTVRDPVPFYIPLMHFERTLLSELRAQLDQEGCAGLTLDQLPVSEVFQKWYHTKHIRGYTKELGHTGELMKEFGGNRTRVYNAILHELTHSSRGGPGLARMQRLRSVNEQFLSALGNRNIEDVEFAPWPADVALWQTISILWKHCGRYWQFAGFLNIDEGFIIFELIRKFAIQWQWPTNMDAVDQALLRNPQFNSTYNVKREILDHELPEDMSEEEMLHFKFEECTITKRPDPNKLPKREMRQPKARELSNEDVVCGPS
ncbi:hypothetical protein BU26DRAFT_286927 [Trematosphaeria pertusa]|uniref:Uncharacterized protein n=1 Tax=Trematosphaeria pertusa TaxID=390896 RepID=A0A6A6IGU6_9PLEO|nr:uncharacterized protein BU26DRAFT_286927 [Trematosphaeria pertusa]KAF2249641.1 hypothetical protein BU26DRAFT_286927 [Trematosphaeria pertusa]